MAMITVTSPSLAFENGNEKFREVSFSSYLDSTDGAFVRKLAESGRDFGPKGDDEHDYLGTQKEEDGEIGVFGAERYFNGGTVEASTRSSNISPRSNQFSRSGRTGSGSVQVKLLPGTPTIQSESSTSSWNSQSVLLQPALPRNASRSKSFKGQGKSFLANFGCRCYCSDLDSVEIKEPAANIAKTPVVTPDLEATKISEPCFKDDPFAFPTINAVPEIPPSLIHFQTEQELAEMARKSLEVFGSPVPDKRSKSSRIGKRLSMLSWDSKETDYTKQKFIYETESDASSDLFEIESLAGKNSPFLARQGSADAASCYAPSEASIEWSVVTASAAEFSIISDYDESRSSITVASPRPLHTPKNKTSSEVQRRRAGSLLGCKSHKAVHVAEEAYVRNERLKLTPRMQRASGSYTPAVVTRFQGDPRMGILDYRHRPQTFATPSGPGSNSPRASPLLHIQ